MLGIDPCYTRVLAEIDSPEKCAFQLSVAGNWGGVCSAGERHVYSSGAQEITVLEMKLFMIFIRELEVLGFIFQINVKKLLVLNPSLKQLNQQLKIQN